MSSWAARIILRSLACLLILRNSVAPPSPDLDKKKAALQLFETNMKAITDKDEEIIMDRVEKTLSEVFGALTKDEDGSAIDQSAAVTEADDLAKNKKRDPEQRQALHDQWGGAEFRAHWTEQITEGTEQAPKKKKILGNIIGNYKNGDSKCHGSFNALVELEVMVDPGKPPEKPENEPSEEIPMTLLETMRKKLGLSGKPPTKNQMNEEKQALLKEFEWEKPEIDEAETEIQKAGRWVFVNPANGFTFTSLTYKNKATKFQKTDGIKSCRVMKADMQEILFESAEDGSDGKRFVVDDKRNGFLKSEVIAYVKVAIHHCKKKLSPKKDEAEKLYKKMKDYVCESGFAKPRWMLWTKDAKNARDKEYEEGSELLERFVKCVNHKMIAKVGNNCANVYRKYNIGRKLEMTVCDRKGTQMTVRSIAKGIRDMIYYVPTFWFKYWQFRGVEYLSPSERGWLALGALATGLAGYSTWVFTLMQFHHDWHILKFFAKENAIHIVAHFQVHAIKEAVEQYTIVKCSHFDATKESSYMATQLQSFREHLTKETYLAETQNNLARLGGPDRWASYFFIVKDESKERADDKISKLSWFGKLVNKALSSDKDYDRYVKYASDLQGQMTLTPEEEDNEKLVAARMFGYFRGYYEPRHTAGVPNKDEQCEGFFAGAFDVALVRPPAEEMKKIEAAEAEAMKKEVEAEKALSDEVQKLAKEASQDEFTAEEKLVSPGELEDYKSKTPKSVWQYKYQSEAFDQQLVFFQTRGGTDELIKELDDLSADENEAAGADKAKKKALNIMIKGVNEITYDLTLPKGTDAQDVKAKKTSKQKIAKGACRNLARDTILQLMQDQPERVSVKVTGFSPRQVRAIVRASVASCIAQKELAISLADGAKQLVCQKRPDNLHQFQNLDGAKKLAGWTQTTIKLLACVAKEAMARFGDDKCKHLLEGDQVVVALQKQLCGKMGWKIFKASWFRKSYRKMKNVFTGFKHSIAEDWGFLDSDVKIGEPARFALSVFALEATLVQIGVPVLAIVFFVAEWVHLWPAVLAQMGFKIWEATWMKTIQSVAAIKCEVEREAKGFSKGSVNQMTDEFLDRVTNDVVVLSGQ